MTQSIQASNIKSVAHTKRPLTRPTMPTQKFVGTKPVDDFPPEAVAKIPDDELNKREANRDPAKEPGANKRAGAATRDPKGNSHTVA